MRREIFCKQKERIDRPVVFVYGKKNLLHCIMETIQQRIMRWHKIGSFIASFATVRKPRALSKFARGGINGLLDRAILISFQTACN